jgi:hypothetical protein
MAMECHCGVAIGLRATQCLSRHEFHWLKLCAHLRRSPPFRLAYLTKLRVPVRTENAKNALEDKTSPCRRLAAIIMACHWLSLIGCFPSLPQV